MIKGQFKKSTSQRSINKINRPKFDLCKINKLPIHNFDEQTKGWSNMINKSTRE